MACSEVAAFLQTAGAIGVARGGPKGPGPPPIELLKNVTKRL